ncbi:subclass B3 metallo-beta-lactamase [Chitinophaga nivalis]|uniref:Subclass B3 metallo-beta-lactamase n=1 Tax=Chitinophaga nivalis TaxID=2991709 RepID=A0ABT3IH93_9BACT|nr:subclass B3 metallo-beta-lactamase [Chitinophaga nivalis]MCW3466983.1 subclass B3 metallo-beta-lactamase [Chitinophaga nivalis]MCW3483326.1 subclass B3 metallo-beta-lactamase [Chitinophaga nivalis]
MFIKKYLLSACLLLVTFWASAQKVVEPAITNAKWNKPYSPFQIAGNLYYVGTAELAVYLIVTPQGNILINTGAAASASMIKRSIAALGFKLADTKILLNTQAHYDHMGAMAAIKAVTGAKMMVNEGDAGVVADGGLSDYSEAGKVRLFAPVKVDRVLHNGDTIKLGGMQLVMLHHPGHTKGSSSFLFDVKDASRSYRVLIANMPTIVTSKRFDDIPAYPGIAKDYAYTLHAMKKLSFDIWLASHASQFGLESKHKPGSKYNPAAFMDRKEYDAELKDLEEEYLKKVKQNKQ